MSFFVMPIDDPTRDIKEVLDACLEGRLPDEAYSWAKSAMSETEETLSKINDMEDMNIYETPDEDEVLETIYKEAWQWLIQSRN